MTFDDFDKQLFEETALHATDRGNGHWQVKLPSALTLNYYPNSSRRTVYVNPQGSRTGIRGMDYTENMTIKMVQDLCNEEATNAISNGNDTTEDTSNNNPEEHL